MSDVARVAVVRSFGPPSVITLEQHPLPPLRHGQVRVAVRTGGLNPVDARRRAGTFGGGVPMTLGTEFAGVVIESKGSHWNRGDEVIGWGVSAADADAVTTVDEQLLAKPADVPWDVAGGLSGVGQSALTALDAVGLGSGDVLVVHGAAGGVGTVLVQLAVARGIKVIGTAGESNQDHLRALGATAVTYGPGLAGRIATAADGAPVAASIDLAGSRDAGDVARSVQAAGGRAITLVPETMASHRIQLVQVQRSKDKLRTLLAAVLDGSLKFPVETLPFTEIVAAHARLDAGHSRGKLVLDLSDNPLLPTGQDA